jgi:hypothetical protein
MKTLLAPLTTLTILLLANIASGAPTLPRLNTKPATLVPQVTPVGLASLPSSSKTSVSDVLDNEIGSGHVLRITLKSDGAKPLETVLATVQGRTDTQFFISPVHFRIYHINPGGFSPGSPPDWAIQIDKQMGQPIPTLPLSDEEAVTMLETNPQRFHLGKAFATFGEVLPVNPNAIMHIEWLRLPASALPSVPLPARVVKPTRVNPSLSPLWPR